MKVLHLAWEYPPYKVGGLGTHIEELAQAQAQKGITPIVIACSFEGKTGKTTENGVTVYRFDSDHLPAEDFPSWALEMNILMYNQAAAAIAEEGGVDVIHAHDWIVSSCAVSLKHTYRIPLVSTIHSLEVGRRGGIYDDRQTLINDLEEKMAYESWRVIACSHFMKQSISETFHTPWDKIDVIPNGVNIAKHEIQFNKNEIRSRYSLPHEKLILFVGRHVWEKGVDVALGAIHSVLKEVPDAKLVIVGHGYMTDKCKALAHQMGVGDKVCFTGYVDDWTVSALTNSSDVVIVPSRYEPFGIAALDAMACKVPVIVSDTGGLSEIVEHEKDGLKVWCGHSESLAHGIVRLLKDEDLRRTVVDNAYEKVSKIYAWKHVAEMTNTIYSRVLEEYTKNSWKPKPIGREN